MELTPGQERRVREYLEARQLLTEVNGGREPSDQEVRERLEWDEGSYWEVHDLAQPMYRYEEPDRRDEDN